MKRLLIVRSVSFQQLDMNLPVIKEKFPGYEICLLTHPHGVELAKKYKDIDKVYVYNYTGSFQKKNKVPEILKQKFDVVIIPVTNLSGSSFLNVLHYGTSLSANKYYMCNLISEFTRITPEIIMLKRVRNSMFRVSAVILTIPCTMIFALMWSIHYRQLMKKDC